MPFLGSSQRAIKLLVLIHSELNDGYITAYFINVLKTRYKSNALSFVCIIYFTV